MTERLDRIEAGIEQLNATINTLVTELISPAVIQSRANYEHLQALDERLSRIAEGQATNEQQIASNSESISRLEALVEQNAERAQESDDRFNILISEMRFDRRANQQAVQALLLAMAGVNSNVAELSDRVDGLEAS